MDRGGLSGWLGVFGACCLLGGFFARSHVILGIVGGLAWILYFLRSRRVENTFRALST